MTTQSTARLTETLMAPSLVRLFGVPFAALTIAKDVKDGGTDLIGTNAGGASPSDNPLTDKLRSTFPRDGSAPKPISPSLARIFGFSFEGHYHKLPKATIFLVHGDGIEIKPGTAGPEDADAIGTDDIEKLGFVMADRFFASGVKMWYYDKLDMSMRVDLASGWLTDILFPLVLDDGDVTGRADLAGRADVTGRADLAGRADLTGRADLISRSRNR